MKEILPTVTIKNIEYRTATEDDYDLMLNWCLKTFSREEPISRVIIISLISIKKKKALFV